MSNKQSSDKPVQADSLQSVTGGSLFSSSSSANEGNSVMRPVHSVCGSTLLFQQTLGVYYCPKCKKEVPFNEIVK